MKTTTYSGQSPSLVMPETLEVLVYHGTVIGECRPMAADREFVIHTTVNSVLQDMIFMLTRPERLPSHIKPKLRLLLE